MYRPLASLLFLSLALQAQDAPAPEPPPDRPRTAAPTRVLFVSGSPGWDYRYVTSTLRRDRAVSLQAYLLSASAEFEQTSSQDTRPLTALPRQHIDLFEYDVVLLSDLRVEDLGATDGERKAFQRDLDAFVRRGGGLALVCSGGRLNPTTFAAQPLSALMPRAVAGPIDPEPAFRIEPPTADTGRRLHPVLRLGTTPATDAAAWRRATRLTVIPVAATAPWEVLLWGVDDDGTRLPLLLGRTHGRGRVLVTAAEDTWRLRAAHGPEGYNRLWLNTVTWLAGER